MKKIIVSEFLTMDGVMEDPAWTFQYWNDEIARYKFDELISSDTLLLGRVTYQGFAASWPSRTNAEDYADRMNSLPKYVVSTKLKEAGWNNSTIIGKKVTEELSRLKEQSGLDILLFGSGKLVQTLIRHDLVDQYNILLYPIVLGKGKRLFQNGSNTNLRLVNTRIFSSGVVALTYQPDEKQAAQVNGSGR